MDFDTDRWIGRSEKPDSRFPACLGRSACRHDDGVDEIEPQQPVPERKKLAGTIVAALDRDSSLRHKYLMKRWRGVTY
jgi:hypothetical protein